MDAIAAEGTVPVEDLIPMQEASARLGLSRSSVAISSRLVGTRRFVSLRALLLFHCPAPRRHSTADHRRPMPEPQPGRLWRVREVADLLGGFDTKVLRLIASGHLPVRKSARRIEKRVYDTMRDTDHDIGQLSGEETAEHPALLGL